jgi:hypothetical protein
VTGPGAGWRPAACKGLGAGLSRERGH